jgi:SP family myo-inositol transporter-like MFS transporter 13
MVIGLGCIWFTVGSVVASASYSVLLISVARFIVGVGVGIVAMINPIYIAELSPSNRRGRMVTINSMFITGGQVIAYGIGAAFAHVSQGWRYMFAIGAIPSLLLVALLPLLPETPRQLLYHDKHDDAFEVLRQIYPTRTVAEIRVTASRIEAGVRRSATFDQGIPRLKWALHQLYHHPAHFRSLFSACGVMAIQQLCGFNSLMYYSATLFAMVGFGNPVAIGLLVAGTNFLFTVVALRFIDRRRRRMLVASMWGLPVGLTLAAVAFRRIPIDPSTLQLSARAPRWAEILVLISIILYVSFYAFALGNVPWQANELLAMEVRAVGTAMLTMTCWGCNILVSATFLSLMKAITPSGAFGLYAGICFFGWIFVIFFYPEVAGLSLEGIREVFEVGFGVERAEKLQEKRRRRKDEVLAKKYLERMRGKTVKGGIGGGVGEEVGKEIEFPGA